jgi:hypothetical protein
VSSNCSNFRTRLARSPLFEEGTSNERVSVYGESGSWAVGCEGECGRFTGVRLAYRHAAADTPRRRHEPQGVASRGQRILRTLQGSQEMGNLRLRAVDILLCC